MLRSPSVSGLRAPEAPPPHLARIAVQLQQITVEICTARGGGSGILWARDLVVTNAHVTRAACVAVGFADERQAEARLLAADVRADLALFQIPPVAVTPAVLADSDALRVGDLVVALGNPLRRMNLHRMLQPANSSRNASRSACVEPRRSCTRS